MRRPANTEREREKTRKSAGEREKERGKYYENERERIVRN